mgnify:CR=1 FL=1
MLFIPFAIYAEELKMDWQKNWGGNDNDGIYELLQTEDGGFIACGFFYSTDIEGLPNNGDSDAIIVKYDKDGNMLWQKNWGGNSWEDIDDVIQTEDGGFITVGYFMSDNIEDIVYTDNGDAVIIKYDENGEPVIQGIKRISKPGLRIYSNCEDMPKVRNGLGIAIVSTPKGIMTDKQARKENVGGEVLAFVW